MTFQDINMLSGKMFMAISFFEFFFYFRYFHEVFTLFAQQIKCLQIYFFANISPIHSWQHCPKTNVFFWHRMKPIFPH